MKHRKNFKSDSSDSSSSSSSDERRRHRAKIKDKQQKQQNAATKFPYKIIPQSVVNQLLSDANVQKSIQDFMINRSSEPDVLLKYQTIAQKQSPPLQSPPVFTSNKNHPPFGLNDSYSRSLIYTDDELMNLMTQIRDSIIRINSENSEEFDNPFVIQQIQLIDINKQKVDCYHVNFKDNLHSLGPNFLFIHVIPNVISRDSKTYDHFISFVLSDHFVYTIEIIKQLKYKVEFLNGYLFIFYFSQDTKLVKANRPSLNIIDEQHKPGFFSSVFSFIRNKHD